MIKRDKNFRMVKQTKRQLAMLFPPLRGQYKNLMINAQIASAIAPKQLNQAPGHQGQIQNGSNEPPALVAFRQRPDATHPSPALVQS